MKETNIANLTVNISLGVDFDTACTCMKLIELYLNKNPDEELVIYCSECGDWDLDIVDRKKEGDNDYQTNPMKAVKTTSLPVKSKERR